MLHGDEKVKSISRSVLPASRNTAKTTRGRKRSWNQTTRRRMDREIDDFFTSGSSAEEIEESYLDSNSTHVDAYNPGERHAMSRIRNKRRQSDKLGPVTRWTASQVDDFDDRADLLAHISDVLPDNLAGRHALSHMKQEFDDRPYWWPSRPTPATDREIATNYAVWERLITALFERDHKALNRAIKQHRTTSLSCYFGCKVLTWRGTSIAATTEIVDDRAPVVMCRECSRGILNTALPLVRTAEDIPLFIERLGNKVGPYVYGRSWNEQSFDLVDLLREMYANIRKGRT